MKIKINKISSASPAEWDETWRNCDYATYFHSREWAEIWNVASAGRMRPAARLVMFSDGQKAIIPLSRCGQRVFGLIKEYISSPEGTYGGWISNDSLSLEHAQLLTDCMLKKCGNLLWRVNPYDSNVFKTGIKRTDRETYKLDLSAGFDMILRGFSKGNISSTHKAQKKGVHIRTASTMQDWQDYFKAYEDSLVRWGEKIKDEDRYNWELFREIYNRNSPYIRLWLATYNERIVSGALCFYAKRHVVYWHGATLKDYFVYRPTNLLLHEIIKNTCKNGYAWFDFNPSYGLEGVIAFKKSFGTESASCPIIQVRTRTRSFLKRVGLMNKYKSFINKFKIKGNA